MPVYEYTALDASGRKSSGLIDADSPLAARQRLRDTGIFPVEVGEALLRAGGDFSGRIPFTKIFQRVKVSELAMATRQLSILLGAGVPLIGCLEAIIGQTGNPSLKRVMAQVKDAIN